MTEYRLIDFLIDCYKNNPNQKSSVLRKMKKYRRELKKQELEELRLCYEIWDNNFTRI